VAVTAQVLPQEKELVLNAGFDSIILKPFSQDTLFQELYKTKTSDFNTEFDLTIVQEMIGDKAELNKIVIEFKQESKNDIIQIQQMIDEDSFENMLEIVLVVHRLAGRLSQFGSRKYAALMRDFEQEMKENQHINQKQLREVLDELNQILE
jgi:HPt (histidine-containing phosphotransfer) domain-containing protein